MSVYDGIEFDEATTKCTITKQPESPEQESQLQAATTVCPTQAFEEK